MIASFNNTFNTLSVSATTVASAEIQTPSQPTIQTSAAQTTQSSVFNAQSTLTQFKFDIQSETTAESHISNPADSETTSTALPEMQEYCKFSGSPSKRMKMRSKRMHMRMNTNEILESDELSGSHNENHPADPPVPTSEEEGTFLRKRIISDSLSSDEFSEEEAVHSVERAQENTYYSYCPQTACEKVPDSTQQQKQQFQHEQQPQYLLLPPPLLPLPSQPLLQASALHHNLGLHAHAAAQAAGPAAQGALGGGALGGGALGLSQLSSIININGTESSSIINELGCRQSLAQQSSLQNVTLVRDTGRGLLDSDPFKDRKLGSLSNQQLSSEFAWFAKEQRNLEEKELEKEKFRREPFRERLREAEFTESEGSALVNSTTLPIRQTATTISSPQKVIITQLNSNNRNHNTNNNNQQQQDQQTEQQQQISSQPTQQRFSCGKASEQRFVVGEVGSSIGSSGIGGSGSCCSGPGSQSGSPSSSHTTTTTTKTTTTTPTTTSTTEGVENRKMNEEKFGGEKSSAKVGQENSEDSASLKYSSSCKQIISDEPTHDSIAQAHALRHGGRYVQLKVRFHNCFSFKCSLNHKIELTSTDIASDKWCTKCSEILKVAQRLAKKKEGNLLDKKVTEQMKFRCCRGHLFTLKPSE